MHCQWIKRPDGGVAIVCGTLPRPRVVRCAYCHKPHARLCDGDLGARGQTCDRPLCLFHVAAHVEPDTDYCLQHAPAAAHG